MAEIDIRPAERHPGDPERDDRGARSECASSRAVPPATLAHAAARRLDERLGRARWTWCGGLLAVFALLLWQVRGAGLVPALDARVRRHVLAWSAASWAGPLDPWAHRLADLGDVVPAIPALLVVGLLVSAWRHSLRPAWTALLGFAVLGGVVVPAKLLIARPGPGSATLSGHHLGYFPSGHTADAMLCYGTAALILTAGGSPNVRRVVGAVVGVLIALVGAALIWCDYHWTSDVLGSFALCGAALILLAATLPRRADAPPARCTPGR